MARENIVTEFSLIVKMPLVTLSWTWILISILGEYSEISKRKMILWKRKKWKKETYEISPTLTPSLYLEIISQIWLREVKPKEKTGSRVVEYYYRWDLQTVHEKEGTVWGWGVPRVLDRGLLSSHWVKLLSRKARQKAAAT